MSYFGNKSLSFGRKLLPGFTAIGHGVLRTSTQASLFGTSDLETLPWQEFQTKLRQPWAINPNFRIHAFDWNRIQGHPVNVTFSYNSYTLRFK